MSQTARQLRKNLMITFLQNYKVDKGCADCGYNSNHAGLEFDHLAEKFKNIGSMLEYSMKRVLAEVAKCDVVCGTCHNIRTYNRRHGV